MKNATAFLQKSKYMQPGFKNQAVPGTGHGCGGKEQKKMTIMMPEQLRQRSPKAARNASLVVLAEASGQRRRTTLNNLKQSLSA